MRLWSQITFTRTARSSESMNAGRAIALGVAEREQVPTKVLTRQSIPGPTAQLLEPLAHVGDSGVQIDPCGWNQSKHGLRPLQCTHQAFERIGVKVRMYLDPVPPGSTTASPQLGWCCVGDFLAANSTGSNPPGRRRSSSTLSLPGLFLRCRFSGPKLKPRLRQNSVRRMPLQTNSATDRCTCVRVRRRRADIFCFLLIQPLHHKRLSSKRCVA